MNNLDNTISNHNLFTLARILFEAGQCFMHLVTLIKFTISVFFTLIFSEMIFSLKRCFCYIHGHLDGDAMIIDFNL